MANEEHLARLREGGAFWDWNDWRENNPQIVPDLREADLSGRDLTMAWLAGVDLTRANLSDAKLHGGSLSGANLTGATLTDADLRGADLRRAVLREAILPRANLSEAKLPEADLHRAFLPWANLREAKLHAATVTEAILSGADLGRADLSGADLIATDLVEAQLVRTDLRRATLVGCKIYGISAWGVQLEETTQIDLIVNPADEQKLTTDSLEVAQFIYLLLHNEKIREVIDTIGKKGVLILGRFAAERKAVLDALRMALRQRGFLPIVFDFEKPTQRDFTETIRILAGLCLFVIADITNPRSAPLELQATVLDYMIPFVPIIAEGEEPFAMFVDLQRRFDSVLEVLTYDSIDHLLTGLEDAVIAPALQKHEELLQRRARAVGTRHIQQYLRHGDARP
jgi:uncharacterized protein YjbI with pentapeptide repeats